MGCKWWQTNKNNDKNRPLGLFLFSMFTGIISSQHIVEEVGSLPFILVENKLYLAMVLVNF